MSAPIHTAVVALLLLGALAPAGQATETAGAAWQTASLIPRPPHWGKTRHKAKPKPTAKPSAAPKQALKQSPSPAPVPTPSVAPSAAPTPAVTATEPGVPSAEGTLGTWILPTGTGGYDFTFSKPTAYADGSLWWGNLGVGAGVTVFNTVYASFRTTPYFQANTFMTDALIKYRFDQGRYQLFGGYRGLGMADVNFATVGFGLERPLVGDWLSLDGRAQYGNSFSGSYVVDGQLGLDAFLDPLVIRLGFRHMALQAGSNPLFQVNGPTAGIGLRF